MVFKSGLDFDKKYFHQDGSAPSELNGVIVASGPGLLTPGYSNEAPAGARRQVWRPGWGFLNFTIRVYLKSKTMDQHYEW